MYFLLVSVSLFLGLLFPATLGCAPPTLTETWSITTTATYASANASTLVQTPPYSSSISLPYSFSYATPTASLVVPMSNSTIIVDSTGLSSIPTYPPINSFTSSILTTTPTTESSLVSTPTSSEKSAPTISSVAPTATPESATSVTVNPTATTSSFLIQSTGGAAETRHGLKEVNALAILVAAVLAY